MAELTAVAAVDPGAASCEAEHTAATTNPAT